MDGYLLPQVFHRFNFCGFIHIETVHVSACISLSLFTSASSVPQESNPHPILGCFQSYPLNRSWSVPPYIFVWIRLLKTW